MIKSVYYSSLRPVPLPDEVPYSVAARHGSKWHLPARQAASFLFGGTASASVTLPGYLEHFSASLPRCKASNADMLISGHTLLPMYIPFVDAATAELARDSALHGIGVHLMLGLAASRVARHSCLMLCMHCARDDLAHYGTSYWHREHQAEGVLVCAKHKVVLFRTEAKPYRRYASPCFVSAERAKRVAPLKINPSSMGHAVRIATDVYELLSVRYPVLGMGKLHTFYRNQLCLLGFMDNRMRINRVDLIDSFNERYGVPFLRQIGCIPEGGDSWLIRIFKPYSCHYHPLYHVLVVAFLGYSSISAFFASASIGVCYCKEVTRLPSHIKNLPLPKIMERKQAQWLAALKSIRPGISIRHKYSALYSWLHRNCKAWLQAHRSQGRNRRKANLVKWAIIDTRLEGLIGTVSAKIRQSKNPWRRASRSAIATECLHPAWLINDHPYLPKSTSAIKRYAESTDDFACRRISLIRKKYKQVWRLRTAAGISITVASRPQVAEALRLRIAC